MIKLLGILLICSSITAESKISGLGFYNYTYNLTEGASGSDKSSFAFDRVYFTYENTVSDVISFKLQTDVGRFNFVDEKCTEDDEETCDIVVGEKSNLFAYIKKAQLDWKSPISKITLGMQGMNVFNVTEKTWGFRFIEKSPMDYHGFSSSADMGIGISGKFSDISYSLLSTNGVGYKKVEDDAFKKTSIQLVYGEKKLVKNDGFNVGTSLTFESYHSEGENYMESVMAFFGGYAGSGFRVGAEFDTKTDSKTELSEQIIAFYGSYKVTDIFEGLVYVDMYDPWTDSVDKDNETYVIVGVNYYAGKGLTITPNIRMTSYENEEVDSNTIFKMNFEFKF